MPLNLMALSQTIDAASQAGDAAASSVVDIAMGDDAASEAALENPAKTVLGAVGAVMGLVSLPMQIVETGIAAVTAPLAAILPAFPAATLGSLYVGAPHAHAHPPSFIPPAPPIPLPSLGAVTLGTSLQVLIGGMPAARAGDLGLAPTCVGLAPFFSVALGSSKVFVGGARAARMTDMCTACTPSKDAAMRAAMGAMKVAKTAAKSAAIMGVLGVAADLTDAAAAAQDNAAVAAASALAAGMQAAQIAADVAAAALSATMGMDPALPPSLPGFIMLGAPNVLIAGAPFPNTADFADAVFKKLKALAKKAKDKGAKRPGRVGKLFGGCGCPG